MILTHTEDPLGVKTALEMIASATNAVPGDPRDEIFLSCAVEAGADVIVSGDQHLLNLAEYRGIPVVTVQQFCNRLETSV